MSPELPSNWMKSSSPLWLVSWMIAQATTFDLSVGDAIHLVVDGATTQSGAFDLTLGLTCQPVCAAGACGGDDGCGGTCGCDAGAKCVAGACVLLGVGESCADPIVLASDVLPMTFDGDTAAASNQFALVDECGDALPFGGGSNDLVFRFTALTAGVYPIDLVGFDGGVVASSDCAAQLETCLDAAEADPVAEHLALDLAANETIYLVVDGYANLSNVAGAFELTLGAACTPTCGGGDGDACGEATDGCGGGCPCAGGLVCELDQICAVANPGDTCADALPLVGALPLEVDGTTSNGAGDGGGLCDGTDKGVGAPDVVYAFTPSASGDYLVSVPTALDNDPSLLSVFAGSLGGACAETCLAAADLYEIESGALTVTLAAGSTYYLMLDGFLGGGDFTLRIEQL